MSTSSPPDQLSADQTPAGQTPTGQAPPAPPNNALPNSRSAPNNVINLTEEPDDIDVTESLLTWLKGQQIVVPNFAGVFSCWPHATNPEYLKLKTELEAQMESILPDDYLRRKVQAADPALIVSMFWPKAPIPTLRILCHLVIWQGVFDDQVEVHNKHTPEKSLLLRADMKNLINRVLAIPPFLSVSDSFDDTAIAKNFEAAADGIWSSYDEEQRRRLLGHLHQYIDATAEESTMVEAGCTPEWLEYWELRARAGGVSPLLGMLEFVAGPGLPQAFFESSEFVTACKSLNIVVSLTNDLVSMKKEMSARFVFSAVPILYNGLARGDLDLAVAHVLFRIREAATSLGQALDTLDVQYSEKRVGPEVARVAKAVIGGVKHIMTGNFFWSVRCKRYGMAKCLKKDGSLVFTL